jgi:hypothetical protein
MKALHPPVKIQLLILLTERSLAGHRVPLRTLCGFPWAAKRTGPPVPSRPVLIPFLRTVYSAVQFRNPYTNAGDIAGFQLHVMLHLHKE